MTVSEDQIDLAPPLAASSLEQVAAELVLPRPVDRPSFVFLGIVSALTLFADIATKAWAEVAINQRGFEPLEVVDGYLSIILAYNRGGAWGLLHNASELVRRPFFLCVSAAAILFIVSLYAKLVQSQKALSWGLPLVLGGALGNLSDRISRSQVIDFIDFNADWVLKANAWIAGRVPGWTVTDHWPTFNVADVAICVGVGLMAVDMLGKRAVHPTLSSLDVAHASPANASAATASVSNELLVAELLQSDLVQTDLVQTELLRASALDGESGRVAPAAPVEPELVSSGKAEAPGDPHS